MTSWAIFIAIAALGTWYYTRNSTTPPQRGRPLQRAGDNSKDTSLDWIESEAKTKVNAAAKAVKNKTAAPRKAAKKASEKVEAYVSGASSTAGADDDQSPIVSSAPAASAGTKAPSGRDVSDMLEAQAPAPKVMSIKPSEKPARPSKPQEQRSETPQETKKQRQNRKKAEEAKATRQAQEAERKTLEEQQRRAARIARGEPAKNGLQAAPEPNSNAWTAVGSSKKAPAVLAQGQLLDTFEPEVVPTATSSEARTNGKASAPSGANLNALPSEEEQMRLAMEDSAWTTVAKPKKQRKTKVPGEEDGSDSGIPQEAAPVQAPIKKNVTKPVENTKPLSRYELLAQPTSKTHADDSDWPVV